MFAVYATFVIDKDGSVTDVQIMRGVHPDVDKAVINVIKNSPRWEPGMNNGRYVKVKFTIPVAFKLI
ncbi:MAG: energy transducer TonB [Bacteroidales bacterium]|nr:energy transducer TonB [Bacteroidales bacterium]